MPTLDEVDTLPRLLTSLRSADQASLAPGDPPVFVADGGSTDGTCALAEQFGTHLVRAPVGRGSQIRAGADAAWSAGATVVVIAHADTSAPPDFFSHLEAAYLRGAVGGGCLLRFEPAPGLLRFGAPLVNWRTRRFKVPLGDQLQWVTRPGWDAVGGMQPWPILEDLDLIRRLRRVGDLAILPCVATTDARRFVQRGALRTVGTNWLIWTLFALGMAPQRLRSLYRHIR